MASGIPTDYKERKETPIMTGVIDYFPDAMAEIAKVSFQGNVQHNPGEPLHWAKHKSQDEADAAMRHFIQRFEVDSDGTYHAAKACWRMLAFLQKFIEAKRKGMEYEEYNKFLRDMHSTPRQNPANQTQSDATGYFEPVPCQHDPVGEGDCPYHCGIYHSDAK